MKSVSLLCGIAVVGFLSVPSLGNCQEPKPKATQMPVDGPGPVHKQMENLAGSWDVEVTYIFNGKENKGKARCEAKSILDGRFLQQDYESNFMGKPFHVIQILGYDNQKKKTTELMMDNLSTRIMQNEGSISKDGKIITNEGEHFDPILNKMAKLRTVRTIIDQDHFTLEWFSPGADGKDEKGVSMTHTRRKQ
jgi:hypothetical protein